MISWIEQTISQYEYLGIFALMVLENIFPPIPSEIILPMTGMLAAGGEFNSVFAIVAATLGAFAGAIFWYWIGTYVSQTSLENFVARHGRWVGLTPPEYKKVTNFFNRNDSKSIFFAHFVPAFRTFISIPAGMFNIPKWEFALASLAGITMWNTILFSAGYFLHDSYMQASETIDMFGNGIIVLLIVLYLYKVIRYRPGKSNPT